MNRHVYTLGGLLVVALVLSYLSWTREAPSLTTGGVKLAEVSAEHFESLRWITPESTVEISAKDDVFGRWFQVTVETAGRENGNETPPVEEAGADEEALGDVPEGDPTAADHESPNGEEAGAGEDAETTDDEPKDEPSDEDPEATTPVPAPGANGAGSGMTVVFTGGLQADRVVEFVTPLMATRSIEKVPADRLEAMGLTSSESRLEITARGRTHVFELGGRTYGGGHQYLRRVGEATVHLVEAGPLRPIEHGARRLMKRELLDLRRDDIESLTVERSDGRRASMVHRGREAEGARSFFADASDPERRVEEYGNWIGKVLALRVFEYVSGDAVPANLEPVLLLTFRTQGSGVGIDLELHRRVDDTGEDHWYARSGHTRALVSLPKAAATSVIADLGGILGG